MISEKGKTNSKQKELKYVKYRRNEFSFAANGKCVGLNIDGEQ